MKEPDLNKKMIGVVDGDVLLFRCCFAAEKKREVRSNSDDTEAELRREVAPLSHALQNVETVIKELRKIFDSLEFYLSGKKNFRKEIATIKPYKGNRSEFQRPVHLNDARDFLVNKYDAIITDGVEADDAIGIRATSGQPEDGSIFCIISNDKDLKQISGLHYNWVKKEWDKVNDREALRAFYRQLLTGDTGDNIPGVDGIGPANAHKIIDPFTKEQGMWQTVLEEYNERYPNGYHNKSVKNALLELGQLLWIQRTGRISWSPPT